MTDDARSRRADGAPDETSGDPACWLQQVCHECGAFVEAPLPTICWRCGSEVAA
jgi:hypothetical protein